MTSTEQHPTAHTVPGWRRPAWATTVGYQPTSLDNVLRGTINFERGSDTTVALTMAGKTEFAPGPIDLVREDDIVVDGETGTVTVTEGEPYIYLGEDMRVSLHEAGKLRDALVELLEIANSETVTA